MNAKTILQCDRCDYKTKDFGDFVNHPCRLLQLEKQKKLDRAKSRVNLDSLIFCPTCGNVRQKADEEKRRAGGFGWIAFKDLCLKCQTPYDEDWSFLDKFYCFKQDYVFHLQCPMEECPGTLHVAIHDMEPVLKWSTIRRGTPIPSLERRRLNWQCPQCNKSHPEASIIQHNRLEIMRETYAWLQHYEREGWNQLRYHSPNDERLHGEHWRNVEKTWQQRQQQIIEEFQRTQQEQ